MCWTFAYSGWAFMSNLTLASGPSVKFERTRGPLLSPPGHGPRVDQPSTLRGLSSQGHTDLEPATSDHHEGRERVNIGLGYLRSPAPGTASRLGSQSPGISQISCAWDRLAPGLSEPGDKTGLRLSPHLAPCTWDRDTRLVQAYSHTQSRTAHPLRAFITMFLVTAYIKARFSHSLSTIWQDAPAARDMNHDQSTLVQSVLHYRRLAVPQQ